MVSAIALTLFQVMWSAGWGIIHLSVRSNRKYAAAKEQRFANRRYAVLGHWLFAVQIGISLLAFWSNSSLLLKVHHVLSIQIVGACIMLLFSWLYVSALHHLGANYSPCYDVHTPQTLVQSGPYRYLRHPLYLSKILILVGSFLLTGSAWFLLFVSYMTFEVLKTIRKEEADLHAAYPVYGAYQRRVGGLFPKRPVM